MEWIRSEDERTSQIVKRELNALQRVRGIPNVAHFEYLGGNPIDRYIFLVCLLFMAIYTSLHLTPSLSDRRNGWVKFLSHKSFKNADKLSA
jgi:hypothetical protein